ncbi:hypothetical protein PC113_g12930 [Phytophthora cactorum]|uniref:Uncharacterized protein n=1 Tax=Phytophthora cactorum TaxID=29920 RepID=A0A8T0YYR5_9STRA|nr:hypothetical protein PC113_g12930 [Phytophthora cactorum]
MSSRRPTPHNLMPIAAVYFGLDASARRTELEQANGNRRHSSDQKLSTTHLDGQGTTRIDRGWVVLLGARM